ncbi:MAG: ABC transporter ATP-binding protein [Chloroflexota bacterium]
MLAVHMQGITKRFPGVVANDNVDLALYPGEIHALLGENGAGKTTLMNILFGLYQPDEGQIKVRDQAVTIHSPADAIRLGIGMVHQHFKLVPPFTVAENIVLGLEGSAFLDVKQAERDIAAVAQQYGLDVDPSARVRQLSVGQQQRAEILSSLYRGADVLILDEPTAVLTPQEAERLAIILREMANQGKAIVFISHKLEEVLDLTDRVTVLRHGKVVFEAMTADTDKTLLAREMIGEELEAVQPETEAHVLALTGVEDTSLAESDREESAEVLMEARDLHVRDDRDLPAVRGVDFALHRGEILGVAGVDGNGQRELVETLVRLRDVEQGDIWINGQQATGWKTRDYIANGGAYISEDRQSEGLVLSFDLNRNSVLKMFEKSPFSRAGLLNFGAIESFTRQIMEAFDVRAPGPRVSAGSLSGGNQQKLILARELSRDPHLIVANKPTRGLDIGASAYVHQKLLQERDRGAAILLVSADLNEIFLLSDRIMVMYNGQSMGVLSREDADVEHIGLMMAGSPLSALSTEKEAKV